MNGHVFELHSERKNKAQFADTMEALMIYASTLCKSDKESLNVLFTELKRPKVAEPPEPKITTIKDEFGKTKDVVSKFEETIYSERIKQWIRDEKSLQSSTRALYNIVWGQCSKLMKDKLSMAKNYVRFEEECDVTALLNEIRRVRL